MATIKAFITRHPVSAYFALTFVILGRRTPRHWRIARNAGNHTDKPRDFMFALPAMLAGQYHGCPVDLLVYRKDWA
jgi:hypothetical protein